MKTNTTTRSLLLLAAIAVVWFIFRPQGNQPKEKAATLDIILPADERAVAPVNLQLTETTRAIPSKPADKKVSSLFPTHFKKGTVKKIAIKDYWVEKEYGGNYVLHTQTNLPSPLVVGDKLFVSGGFTSRQYFCFDVKTNQNCWAVELNDDGPSTAVYSDGAVFFNTESCTVFALDYLTGADKWSYWLGDPLLSKPELAGDLLISAYPYKPNLESVKHRKLSINPSHPIVAFQKTTGRIEWQNWLDGDIMVQPVAHGAYLFVVTFPGVLYKIDHKNGEVVAATAMRATSIPTCYGDRLFIPKRSDDSTGVRECVAELNPKNLTVLREFHNTPAPYLDERVQNASSLKTTSELLDLYNGFLSLPEHLGWEAAGKNIGQSNVSSMQMFQGSQIVAQEDLLFTLKGNVLYALHIDAGTVVWSDTLAADNDHRQAGGYAATPPLLHEGKLYTVTLPGVLRVYESHSGRLAAQYPLHQEIRAKPVIDNGHLYVPTTKGELICVDLKRLNALTM